MGYREQPQRLEYYPVDCPRFNTKHGNKVANMNENILTLNANYSNE